MQLKNVMEEVVLTTMEHIMPESGCCCCERCKLDVASYALNRLRPHYVLTTEGELISKFYSMNGQEGTDVTTEVVRAIQVIQKKPNHAT